MSHQQPEMLSYHDKHVETKHQTEQVEKGVTERVQTMLEDTGDQQAAFASCMVDHAQTAMEEVQVHQSTVHEHQSTVHEQSHGNILHTANQKRIVDRVVHSVCDSNAPAYLIVRRQSGTGRSRVIELLNHKVSSKFNNYISVVVSASNGLSAFNVSVYYLCQWNIESQQTI